jgi:hypothetical protein
VRTGQRGAIAQAAEIVLLSREQDTHTLRDDWFSEDGTESEFHEMFDEKTGADRASAAQHAGTDGPFPRLRDRPQVDPHGEVWQDFRNLVNERAAPAVFPFLQGLDRAATA